MALPNDKISTTLVANTLGTSSRDVGSLCTHQAINKWSRNKPVRYPSVNKLTEAQIKSVNSGIVLPRVDGALEIMNFYRANSDFKWDYNKPRGSEDEPFRLGDFAMYEHNASKFYNIYSDDNLASVTTPKYLIQLKTTAPMHPQDPVSNWLGWDSFGLENLYYGVLIVRQNTTTPYVYTFAEEPLIELSSHIFAGMPTPIPQATYDVFSFIAEKDDPQDPRLGQAILIEDGHRTFVYNAGITVFIEGELTDIKTVEYFFRITNNTDSKIYLRNLSLYIRYADTEDPISPIEPAGEYVHNFGTIEVNAGDDYNYSDMVTGVLNEIDNRGAYLYLYASSPSGISSIYPLQPYS